MKTKTIVRRTAPSARKNNVKVDPVPRKNYKEVLIILGFGIVAYIPAFKAGFVNWDDPDYVSKEFLSQGLSNLKNLLITPVQGNYHPLTVLSLFLNYAISGMNAWSYHQLNLLLHLVNSALVFQFVLLLTPGNRIIAFVTAILFAIHPMHVESVAWVSERKDVLYSLFFIAGLISYTKYANSKKRREYALSLLFFVLSLLSKPSAVIFPLTLFCIDIFRKRKLSLMLLVEKIPFFILSLVMGVITFIAQKQIAVDVHGTFNTVTRILMGFYGIMMYFIKMIFPVDLSPFYPFAPINSVLPASYYVAPLFSLLLVVACIYSWQRNRVIVFGILFYIINLLLVLQFLPVGSAIIADRYTYVPYIGLFFVVGWVINQVAKGKTSKAYYLIMPVAVLLSFLTYQQASVWDSSASLWDHALTVNPNYRAYINRAMAFDEEKNNDKALEYYGRGIALNPTDKEARIFRGKIYVKLNKPDSAYQDFKKCLALDSNYYAAMDNLGVIFLGRKQYDSALLNFDRALKIKPDYFSSYRNRALTFLELNKYKEAIADFKNFLKYQPNDPDIYNAIGACYRLHGDYQEAVSAIDKALAIKQDPHFYLNRAYCYGGLKSIGQAMKDALIAKQAGLILDPDFAQQLGIRQ